jgi:hypothetical protein
MRRLILAGAIVLAFAAPAASFSTITLPEAGLDLVWPSRLANPDVAHGYRHFEATQCALEPLGFGPRAVRFVARHDFLVDWDHYAHTLAHPPTARYAPADHFDRNEHESSAMAFERALAALSRRRREVLARLASGDGLGAMATLGALLHGVQDACSHSNAVDLAPGDRARFVALLAGTAGPGRAIAVRLTGTSREKLADLAPNADAEPGFGHDAYSKDDARKNAEARKRMSDGRTKFEAAMALACEAGHAAVVALKSQADPERWRAAVERCERGR